MDMHVYWDPNHKDNHLLAYDRARNFLDLNHFDNLVLFIESFHLPNVVNFVGNTQLVANLMQDLIR